MARTQQERLVEALTNHGFRQVKTRSTTYVVMTKNGVAFYFLGKAGSLRYGCKHPESFPQERLKARLLKEVPQ